MSAPSPSAVLFVKWWDFSASIAPLLTQRNAYFAGGRPASLASHTRSASRFCAASCGLPRQLATSRDWIWRPPALADSWPLTNSPARLMNSVPYVAVLIFACWECLERNAR